jgi:hypothetical protein
VTHDTAIASQLPAQLQLTALNRAAHQPAAPAPAGGAT